MNTLSLCLSLLIPCISSTGVWVLSPTEGNIEYYYISQCIAFNISSGTEACKNIASASTLASVNNAVVQSHIASNVIDRSPTGGCSDPIGTIGTGGTYTFKTIGTSGTISWLNGDADSTDLVHYKGPPDSPSAPLPNSPGLFLSTNAGQYGAAMDHEWSTDGAYYGSAVLCQRNAFDTLPPTLEPTVAQPSASPTLHPSLTPSISPTRMPTAPPTLSPSRNPSISPTRMPTAYPTITPSNAPTQSPTRTPTTIHSGLVFVCRYDDLDMNDYIMHITLSDYASIMSDSILYAIAQVTHYPTDYNETETMRYLHWKRAGLFDFRICSIFADVALDEVCPTYVFDSDDSDVDYTAIGVFGVVVAEALEQYETYLTNTMMGDQFKEVFNDQMNAQLHAAGAGDDADRFEAQMIEIFNTSSSISYSDSDDSNEEGTTQNNPEAETMTIVIIVLIVLLLIIAALSGLVYYVQQAKYKQRNQRASVVPVHAVMQYQNQANFKRVNTHDDDAEKCQIVQRVLDLMMSYETWNELPDGELKWSSIRNVFGAYDLMQVIDDYNHCLSQHQNHEYMKEYLLLRVSDACTKIHELDGDRKYLVTMHQVKSEDVFKLEMVDQMHIHFFHDQSGPEREEKANNEDMELEVELEEVSRNEEEQEEDEEAVAVLEKEQQEDALFAMSFGEEELDNILLDGDAVHDHDEDIVDLINDTAEFSHHEENDSDERNIYDEDSLDMISNEEVALPSTVGTLPRGE